MGTKERVKKIERRALPYRPGIFLVRKAGRGFVDMNGKAISSRDLIDMQEAGGLIITWDESLDGL